MTQFCECVRCNCQKLVSHDHFESLEGLDCSDCRNGEHDA
jgi:hypothetical protein